MGDLIRGETFAAGETVTAARLHKLVEDAEIKAGSVGTTELADGSVTTQKLASGTTLQASQVAVSNGKILVGDVSNVGVSTTVDSATLVTTPTIAVKDAGITATKLATDAVVTDKIQNTAVTYAKVQNVAASRLLGNPTGSPAAPSEISLGNGLEFNGTTLRATGSSSFTVSSGSATQGSVVKWVSADSSVPSQGSNSPIAIPAEIQALLSSTVPTVVQVWLVCASNEAGYVVGPPANAVKIENVYSNTNLDDQAFSVSVEGQYVNVVHTNTEATVAVLHKTTGAPTAINIANWRVRVVIWV